MGLISCSLRAEYTTSSEGCLAQPAITDCEHQRAEQGRKHTEPY